MDYDLTEIPAAYDRGRDHGPDVLDLWMTVVDARLRRRSIARILDLGCGTGRFAEALAKRFNAVVVAVDPSMKMLAIARRKQRDRRVHYQRGRAEAIPLSSQSVDLVFVSMSLHHFDEPSAAARECRRVLTPGGCMVIRTGTREQIESYPYVPFFPASRELLEAVLPGIAGVRDTFEAAGFHMECSEVITQTVAPGWAEYADKLAAGGDSVLARLTREDLDAGLAALRHHAARVPRELVIEPIDLLVFRRAENLRPSATSA